MLLFGIQMWTGRKRTPQPLGSSEEKVNLNHHRFVTYQSDIGKVAHSVHEIIRCTIRVTIGEEHYFLLPTNTVGRFQINRFRIREITVSLSCLMLDVSRQYLFISEAGGNTFRVSKITSAVISHIENQSATWSKVGENFVQITVTDAIGE